MWSNKKDLAIIFGTFVIVLSVIGLYVFIQFSSDTPTQTAFVAQNNDGVSSPSKKSALNNQPETDATLQVQGSSTTNTTSEPLDTQQALVQLPKQAEKPQSTQQLPEPSNFEVYEQYKNQQQALYADIAIGDGEEVRFGDTISVTYQGWLTDGQLFDQSRSNEEGMLEPFTFKIGSQQVIRGWEDGFIGMKIGGKRRLIIPPASGYGEVGSGPIPPNAVLIFDVYAAYIHEPQP